MDVLGDPLPQQWKVTLNDGSVIGVWASAYGQTDEHYTFEVLADASAAEQADGNLVISAETPSNPRRILFVVARIPKIAVRDIMTAGWDDPA